MRKSISSKQLATNRTQRTERRLAVGFACDVACGLMCARSRLKIGAPWHSSRLVGNERKRFLQSTFDVQSSSLSPFATLCPATTIRAFQPIPPYSPGVSTWNTSKTSRGGQKDAKTPAFKPHQTASPGGWGPPNCGAHAPSLVSEGRRRCRVGDIPDPLQFRENSWNSCKNPRAPICRHGSRFRAYKLAQNCN
jgi:hypothetical protein